MFKRFCEQIKNKTFDNPDELLGVLTFVSLFILTIICFAGSIFGTVALCLAYGPIGLIPAVLVFLGPGIYTILTSIKEAW